jgi:hypothetical protein
MAEAYEFKTLKFGPPVSDRIPQVDRELIFGERHVPYSDKTILDIGGYGPNRYASSIRVLAADVAAWRLALGTTGNLYIANVLWTGATLVKLGSHSMIPRQQFAGTWQLDGQYHYFEAEWIMGQIVPS